MTQRTVNVIRSKRKTIAIELRAEGVLVRAPWRMSDKEIRKFLEEKQDWIEKNWKKVQERQVLSEQQETYTEAEIRTLAERALKVIPEKVKQYAPLVGVDYGRIAIENI